MSQIKVQQLRFSLVYPGYNDVVLEIHGTNLDLVEISKVRQEYEGIIRQIMTHKKTNSTTWVSIKLIHVEFLHQEYLFKSFNFYSLDVVECEFEDFSQVERLVHISTPCKKFSFVNCSLLEKYLKLCLRMKLKPFDVLFKENHSKLSISSYNISIIGDFSLNSHTRLYDRCLEIIESDRLLRPLQVLSINDSIGPKNYSIKLLIRWSFIPAINTFDFSNLDNNGLRLGSWMENYWHLVGELSIFRTRIAINRQTTPPTLPSLKFSYICSATNNMLRFLSHPPFRSLEILELKLHHQKGILRVMGYMSKVICSIKLHLLQISMSLELKYLAGISQTWRALSEARGIKNLIIDTTYSRTTNRWLEKSILGRMHIISADRWEFRTSDSLRWLMYRERFVASEPESRIVFDGLEMSSTRL